MLARRSSGLDGVHPGCPVLLVRETLEWHDTHIDPCNNELGFLYRFFLLRQPSRMFKGRRRYSVSVDVVGGDAMRWTGAGGRRPVFPRANGKARAPRWDGRLLWHAGPDWRRCRGWLTWAKEDREGIDPHEPMSQRPALSIDHDSRATSYKPIPLGGIGSLHTGYDGENEPVPHLPNCTLPNPVPTRDFRLTPRQVSSS